MIARLTGTLLERTPAEVVIDVGGVGYRLFVSVQTYQRLPAAGASVDLLVHTHVREDALQLYGFGERAEREIFLLLTQVDGIGPRLALNILSGIPAADLREALSAGDTARLVAIPGVGKKIAERMIVYLRDRVAALAAGPEAPRGDGQDVPQAAVSALVNLGYRKPEAERAVDGAAAAGRSGFEDLFREALRRISR